MRENEAEVAARSRALSVAFRESLLDASEEQLRQTLRDAGLDLDQEAERAQEVIDRALAKSKVEDSSSRRLRAWISAAAVLAAALLLVEHNRRNGRPPERPAIVASSDRAVGVLRPGETEQRQAFSFRVEDTLVNGPAHEQEVHFASGESITLGRCSMVTLEHGDSGLRFAPQLGSMTLQAAPSSCLGVRTSLGDVVLEARARLQIHLLAEGYGLEQPALFGQLAKDLHMRFSLPMILTSVTLLEGSASIETGASPRPLVVGQTIQDQEPTVNSKAITAKLLEEVGTWSVTATLMSQEGMPERTVEGVETCRAGPGDQWLISELMLPLGAKQVTTHTVVGFNARNRRYTGSLVDSFGGEMGFLEGEVGADLEARTLVMFSAESTPGFDVRWHMRWVSPDERRTRFEVLRGNDWILAREFVHRREKD